MRNMDATIGRLNDLLRRLVSHGHIKHAIVAVESVDASFRWTGVAGEADLGAVFLEGDPEHEDAGTLHPVPLVDHELHDPAGDEDPHVVVDAPPGEYHLGMVADLLRLVSEVVRIDADAVGADETGPERQEVPLGTRWRNPVVSLSR
jgi:hypothetical protein